MSALEPTGRRPLEDRRRRFPPGPVLDSLRVRLALPYILLTVIALGGLAVYVGAQLESFTVDRLSDSLEDQARIVADDVQRQLNTESGSEQIGAYVDRLGRTVDARITVIAGDGRVIADSEAQPSTMVPHGTRPEVLAARESGFGRAVRRSDTVGREYLYVAVPLTDATGTVVRLATPLEAVSAAVDRLRGSILGVTLALTLLMIALAWFLARRLARPLEDLRRQAVAVAAGDLSVKVGPSEMRELGELGRAFNTMTRALRRSHFALERQTTRFESILAGLDDGVVLTDHEGIVIRVNAAAARLFNTDQGSSEGMPFIQVCRDHELAAMLATALAGEEHRATTVEHGLNRRTLLTSAQRIEGAHERLGLVILRDISDLRRLESVRRDFVANVSHELRTPLASIRALVETLEAGAIEDERVAADFLARIVQEVDRLNAVVEDLLDLARLEADPASLRMSSVEPTELLRRVAERLRPQIERARLRLQIDAPDTLPSVDMDEARMEQVLVNLIHNAIKFTPAGGAITVGAQIAGDRLRFAVADTGVGIAEEDLSRLFERFYKSDRARRSSGTGLGLAIAKHIVGAHGGQIWVESTAGVGSTFTVDVPVASEQARRRSTVATVE